MSKDTVSDNLAGSEMSYAEGGLSATFEDLYTDLTDLTDTVPHPEAHEDVQTIKHLLTEAHERGLIDSGVRDLKASDAAEAFVGSVIFASPLLVEDGVFDIADHLFSYTLAGIPIFLIANTFFVVLMTYALLEWTGRNTDETHHVAGLIPVRLIMILGVSFLVAALLMTVWGRVGFWESPVQALARVNVIWTVGALGAGLGDILSNNTQSPLLEDEETPPNPSSNDEIPSVRLDRPEAVYELTDSALVDALNAQFTDLALAVETSHERQTVQRIQKEAMQATTDDIFGVEIQKYTSRDIAEAVVGSIFFSIPFLVEDGVFDVAEYFLSFQIGFFPVFFLVNAAFVILMILALVYWAGPQDVQMSRPIFGVIPRRLVGISIVSFLTAAALMTMWGRVANWEDPIVALARISVVWTVASFGAALGDILPGESSGADINDDLAALGEFTSDSDAENE